MMHVQMQNVSQGTAAAAGGQQPRQASGAGKSGGFYEQFTAMLNAQTGQGALYVTAGAGWPFVFPAVLSESGAQPQFLDMTQLRQFTEKLLELIQQGEIAAGAEVWGAFLQLPEVQQWLDEAENVLASNGGNLVSGWGTTSANLSGQSAALALGTSRAERILLEFLQAVHQQPLSSRMQTLAQSFVQVFQPVLQDHGISLSGWMKESEQLGLSAAQAVNGQGSNRAGAEGKGLAQLDAQSDIVAASSDNQPAEHGSRTVGFHLANRMLTAEGMMQKGIAAAAPTFRSASAGFVKRMEALTPSEGKEDPILPAQVFDVRLASKEWTAKPDIVQMPVQHFARHMGEMMVKNLNVLLKNGVSEARISLIPEHLGNVDVRISVQNGQVIAHFFTETMMAKDALEGQIAQLRTALQNQGLQVEKIEVSQQSQLNSAPFGEHQHGQPSRQFYAHPRKAAQYEEWQDDFSIDPDLPNVSAGYAVSGSIDISA